ncbi:MAG: DUF3793 family protein [Fastidiosipilaceae bacterium]|jgi:hypothetical protein|nr:DUF3793 family protein [Clostridiaceae bacterium]
MSDKEKIDWILAAHGSPVIAGLKSANLFSIEEVRFDNWQQAVQDALAELKNKDLRYYPLRRFRGKILLLVYNVVDMENLFADPDRRQFLYEYGYPLEYNLDQCLALLQLRMKNYSDFPHEIGIFLAYALEDVVGFIENEGKGCKLCGYWKVYGDVEGAIQQFKRFREASNSILESLKTGLCLTEAVRQLSLSTDVSA